MGSWRVVDESRPPCPQGARHILQLAGKGFAGRAGGSERGPGERAARGGCVWAARPLRGTRPDAEAGFRREC